MTNTLAYFSAPSTMMKKSFIALTTTAQNARIEQFPQPLNIDQLKFGIFLYFLNPIKF
jgi:hypothetical protein